MLPKMILAGLAAVLGVGVGRGAWEIQHPNQISTAIQVEAAIPELPKPPAVRLMLYASPVWVVVPGAVEKAEATNGQELKAGTKVITDANTRAAIVYPNGTTTVLDYNSEATLKEFVTSPQKITVSVEKNRIWSRVVKLLGEESYQTESSTVVATVRGTSYGHSVLATGEDKLITSEGLVLGNCKASKQNGEVSGGQTTQLKCNDDVQVKSKPITAKDKDEWFEFNAEEDKIEALLKNKESFDKAASSQTTILGGGTNTNTVPSPTPAPNNGQVQSSTTTSNSQPQAQATPRPTAVIRLTPTPTPIPPTPVPLPPGEVYADGIAGLSGSFGACCSGGVSDSGEAARMVLGGPDTNVGEGRSNFIQLGDNSVITLRFSNNRAVNRDGDDIAIHTVDGEFPSRAKIEVGAGPDCGSTSYREVGSREDTSRVGIDIGMSFAHCVRITDLPGDEFPDLGFDLDAVEALHSEEVR